MTFNGWAATGILVLVIASADDGIREWAIWGIGVIGLLILASAVEKALGPWVQDIPEDHPDALGSLDVRERERWAAVAPAFEPVGEDRTP